MCCQNHEKLIRELYLIIRYFREWRFVEMRIVFYLASCVIMCAFCVMDTLCVLYPIIECEKYFYRECQ